jgi:hypothetical protein
VRRSPFRRSLSRPLAAISALLVVASTVAVVTSVSANPYGNSWSGDYATEEHGDPWDFNNQEDWDPIARADSIGVRGHLANGTLNFDVTQPAGGVLIGSAHYGDQALQWGRSTALRPIDGSLYPTVSFRLYVPPGTNAPTAALGWFSCGQNVSACFQTASFTPQPGWHDYTINPNWAGQKVYSLRIVPTPYTGQGFMLDWVRVVRAGGQVTPPAPGTEPVPVVLSPDRKGGEDVAAATGNPWNMGGPEDVGRTFNLGNVTYGFDAMWSCNTNNDPAIQLPLRAPIDGTKYHRLSMQLHYEGGFSLANGAGGGMNARVMWQVAGSTRWQVSQDIIVQPGWNDIDLDMMTFPPAAVNEPDVGGGTGWLGQTITGLRLDFHEDPGRRCVTVADVALRADDRAQPGYTIAFRDDSAGPGATTPGTKAEIFLDPVFGSFSGYPIASGIEVRNGINTYQFSGASDAPSGLYAVRVRLTNAAGRVSQAYGDGLLQYTRP